MTIRRYGELDRTGDLSLLKRRWNPFPVKWFDIESLLKQIADGLNSDADTRLYYEISKSMSLNKIMMLETLYYAIYNSMILKSENEQWGVVDYAKSNLLYYKDKVKELTGIDITGAESIEALKKEITRISDKYNERYNKKTNEVESIPFLEYAYSIFIIVEMPYNPDIKMFEFFSLISTANNKLKQLEKLKAKNGG